MADFKIEVGAKVDTSQISSQLKGYKPTITVKTSLQGGGSKEVTTFTNALDKTIKVERQLNKQGVETSNTIKRISTNAQSASSRIGQLGKDFVTTTGKVLKFAISTAVIATFTAGIREAISTVKEFDDALTEFKKVSDLSGDSLDEYTQKLGELGKTTARTRTEMVSASTNFKKSGYSDEDSAKLAQIATLYQNVADSELDAGESASFIISQMKAFNITADDSIHIIDAVNNVSNNMAVSSTDISTALSKTSSAMGALGNSYEETIGLVSAGTEIMQGQASKVSRG